MKPPNGKLAQRMPDFHNSEPPNNHNGCSNEKSTRSGKRAQKHNEFKSHKYYTPKPLVFQALFLKITIFVDYADSYVNVIMSTA